MDVELITCDLRVFSPGRLEESLKLNLHWCWAQQEAGAVGMGLRSKAPFPLRIPRRNSGAARGAGLALEMGPDSWRDPRSGVAGDGGCAAAGGGFLRGWEWGGVEVSCVSMGQRKEGT